MSAEFGQKLPALAINIEKGYVQRGHWKESKRMRSLTTWDTLMLLSSSVGQPVPERQIREIVLATGSHSRQPASAAINSLRKTLEDDLKNPTLIVTTGSSLLHSGYDTAYILLATVELIGDPSKAEQFRQTMLQKTENHHELRQVATLWLSDGQKILLKGKQQIQCLEQILLSPNPMENDALAKELYGADDKSARNRASAIVSALNRQLESKNWHIAQISKPRPSRPKTIYALEEIRADNSPWGRFRRILAANLPTYNLQIARHTQVLQEFCEVRLRVARGESPSLIKEFENKYGIELIDTLAPALKEITALISPRRIR